MRHARTTQTVSSLRLSVFRTRVRSLGMLLVSGGVLLQLTGCLSGLVPTSLAFAESATLARLLGLL